MSGVKEEGLPFKTLGEAPVRAKLFTHGGSQAVRLPKAFRFEGGEVCIRREGSAVILEPAPGKAPRTRAEVDALFAMIDSLMDGAEITPVEDRYRPPPRLDVDA